MEAALLSGKQSGGRSGPMRTLGTLAALAALLVCLPSGARAEAGAARARWLMGTLCSARATARVADDTLRVGAVLDLALDEIGTLEHVLSNWDPQSELCRLNAAGGPRAVSEPMARETAGAFDPTVEPLTLAWDLRGAGRVPAAALLDSARARVGWRRVRIDPAARTIDLGGTALDLGGIAKGFALDRAADVLRAHGVPDAVLDAGGQRLVAGHAVDIVLVAAPGRREEAAARVRLTAGSLSTSAQSEHFIVAGKKRYGHVLDPRTGRPVASEAAVSVRACSGTRADALSTALLVAGPAAAAGFAAAHSDVGVLWLEPARGAPRIRRWNMDP